MSNIKTFITSIQLMTAKEKTDDWFHETFKPTEEQRLAYFKLRRKEDMIIDAIEEGWERFNFIKAHKAGHLCKNDYDIFEELKGINTKDWNKEI